VDEHKSLLTTKEAAKFLGMSEAFLERDRWTGARIPYVLVGKRAIRYERSVLEAYVQSRIRLSSSAENPKPQQAATEVFPKTAPEKTAELLAKLLKW
jgi:hypothetical protein